MKTWYTKIGLKTKWYHIALLYFLQTALFQIMITFIIPAIESGTGELQILDMMKQGYDVSYVSMLVDSMDQSARSLYLYLQMPLDFIYPVLMAAVFFCLFAKAWHRLWPLFTLLPITLIAFDWFENICIIILFSGFESNATLVAISSFFTQAKAFVGDYVLYFLALFCLIYLVLRFIFLRFVKHS